MKYSVWLWNRIRDWDFAAATRGLGTVTISSFSIPLFSVFCWDSQTLTGESLISEKFRVDQVTSWNSLTNAERKQICLVQSNADQFFDQNRTVDRSISRQTGGNRLDWSYPSIHSGFFLFFREALFLIIVLRFLNFEGLVYILPL